MPKKNNTRHNMGSTGDFDTTPTQLHALPLEEAERMSSADLERDLITTS